jgi:hypothetical protein
MSKNEKFTARCWLITKRQKADKNTKNDAAWSKDFLLHDRLW